MLKSENGAETMSLDTIKRELFSERNSVFTPDGMMVTKKSDAWNHK